MPPTFRCREWRHFCNGILLCTKDGRIFLREMDEISEEETKQYVVFMSDTGKEILK